MVTGSSVGFFFVLIPPSPTERVARIYRKYEEAMQAVTGPQARELKCHSMLQVGRTYLDHLLGRGDYEVAARLCVNILGKSKC